MFKALNRKISGYTLIEILLVIAIISIIATLSLTAYQRRAVNTKVDKTALQIQQLLQAGSAYYTDNGCWPATDVNKSNCQNTQIVPSFDPYIPIAGKTNPWGYDYVWQPTQTNNAPPGSNLFEVQVQVPDESLAKNIAAKLPNASGGITPAGIYQVTAQVSPPGQNGGGGGGMLVKVANTDYVSGLGNGAATHNVDYNSNTGKCGNGSVAGCDGLIPVPSFTCPSGWSGSVVVSSFSFQTELIQSSTFPGTLPIDQFSTSPSCTQQGNQYTCQIRVTFQTAVLPNGTFLYLCSLFGPATNAANCRSTPNINVAPSKGIAYVGYVGYCRPPITNTQTLKSKNPFI